MARWYASKFLMLTGIALCTSALYWGLVMRNMSMEVKLLSLGALFFGIGYFVGPGASR